MIRRWNVANVLGMVVGVAGLLSLVLSVTASTDDFLRMTTGEVLMLLGFFVVIALGDAAPVTILTGRVTAPMSAAAALALATSPIAGAGEPRVGAAAVIATISLGMTTGSLVRLARGTSFSPGDTAARLAGAAVAPLLYRWVPFDGRTLLDWQTSWDAQRWFVAIVMLAVGAIAMLVDLAFEGTMRAGRDHAPLVRSILDEYRSTLGLATALVASGALVALGEYAIGVLALPLFLFPLALTYFSVQRFAVIRTTYRQTIGALSSLTDIAGYTPRGHARRVATLSVAVGRDLGMGARELTDLEYAALLHDLGQVSLRHPIPGGATVMAAPADQQRIAHDGAEIVRSTGVLDTVAGILEAQTTPYRQVREFGQDLPLSSRIVKLANAYDDVAGPDDVASDRAMERIHLGLGYEYDPRVVDSLSRVLARRRRVTA